MDNKRPLIAHLCLFCSGAFWGLMAPRRQGCHASRHRRHRPGELPCIGWCHSLLAHLALHQKSMFQGHLQVCCCRHIRPRVQPVFLHHRSEHLTSPSNSSIMTTSMPIFAMILSFLILKEPITWKKALGVLMGCSGACHHHPDECYGWQCQGGKHLGRPALYVGAAFLRPLPVALQNLLF